MATIRIPTPLRPYAGNQSEVDVGGTTVGEALQDLTTKHPQLRQHLYNDSGQLRAFVNIFLESEDVRHLQGQETVLAADAKLRIVPSVAGGQDLSAAGEARRLPRIDHSALRVNQTVIIALLIAAFVVDAYPLVMFVAAVMTLGTIFGGPGFKPVYKYALQPLGIVQPDVLRDNAEPHRFAQGLGAVFLIGAAAALFLGAPMLGWALSWIVAALAALNLFGGFCAGCFVYYWLGRFHVPGFVKAPPPNTVPGTRPRLG